MSDGRPASDTFIGRLFNRIAPGSSYAAFPWRSWDKICTILETIRGRGIRIKRSTADTKWELDATAASVLDKPHAYSVYVHDPDGDEDDKDGIEAALPQVMRGLSSRTAFCYLPFLEGESANFSGANGPDQDGSVGAMADDEWPEGSHWGWKAVGEVETDDPRVVYGTLAPGSSGTAPEFDGITLADEATFVAAMKASTTASVVVPIAWVNGSNVVQALGGRPWWESAHPSVCPARVVSFNAGVYTVDLYADGILSPRTGRAQLVVPEVSMLASLEAGTIVLAHLVGAQDEASDVENGSESSGQ